jgi:hypothetical protein
MVEKVRHGITPPAIANQETRVWPLRGWMEIARQFIAGSGLEIIFPVP